MALEGGATGSAFQFGGSDAALGSETNFLGGDTSMVWSDAPQGFE